MVIDPDRSAADRLRPLDQLLIAAFLALVFLPGTIGVSLFDRDEGWHGQTVREMLETNDWVIPRYLGEPRYHKTPLLYWCSAVSVSAFGWSEFSLRLPGVLVSITAWTIVATAAARWSGRRTGYWTAILAGTCLGPNLAGKLFLSEPYLLLGTAVAMLCWMAQLNRRPRGAGYGFWAAFGFAILAKGPAIFVVIIPVTLAFLWTEPPTGATLLQRFRHIWPGRGWYLALVVGLPWFAAVAYRDWDEFYSQFILLHSVSRVKEPAEGHWGPPGTYLALGLVVLWPWAALVPSVVASAWKNRREDATTRQLLVWLIAPWVLFELIQTKLPHYVLPLMPPMAMLAGREIARVTELRSAVLRLDRLARVVWVVGLLLGNAFTIAMAALLRDEFAVFGLLALGAVLLLTAVTAVWPRGRPDWKSRCVVVTIGMTAFYQVLGWVAVPQAEPYRLSRLVAEQANKISRADDRIFAYGFKEPSMFYYLERPAGALRPDLTDWHGRSFILITREPKLAELQSVLRLVKSSGRIVEGVNYVRGRRVRIWIGRAEALSERPQDQ